jgi:DNA-binding Xre family transcriptional regulator
MKKEILNKINYEIEFNFINKTDLAKQLNISRTTLWRYLENKKDIPLETFLKICEVLELEIIIK